MVHFRYNEKESNPNSHINFISPLPDDVEERVEEARQLLRALAAQVRPVMKKHGFEVNSLEEYEYNAVFAGRNWNSGETVELVLRNPGGSFYPTYWLMSTLCHELAHIKHMNHGPAFQALWSQLRTEVRQLQARGYYGDGFWSSGTRLRDLSRVGGDGIECNDLPEYVCGGAQTRSRPTATRRRRRSGPRGKRREVVPSLHTGAQTTKKRKAGSRVTSKYAFSGEGITVGSSLDDGKGTGFGKRTNSKRARDMRALAAERRLLALRSKVQSNALNSNVGPLPPPEFYSTDEPLTNGEDECASGDDNDSDGEIEIIAETDADRRQALIDSEEPASSSSGLEKFNTTKDSWKLFKDEFNSQRLGADKGGSSKTKTNFLLHTDGDDDIIEILSSDENCDLPVSSGSTFTTRTRLRVGPSALSDKDKAASSTLGDIPS